MIPSYFKKLSETIVKSWIKKRSNYIIVSPPMSESYLFFKQLVDMNFIKELLGEDARKINITILDTINFKTEFTFAQAVCKGWNIDTERLKTNDPIEMLHCAVEFVTERGEYPVLIIKRFHEALSKLGEDIGTTLRNLEHDFALKTVVELPVSINTLRVKWEQENRELTPFLVSDWGQGHIHKLLKGYDINEIDNLFKSNKLNKEIIIPFFKMTGGLPTIVESLIQDLETINSRSFEPFCISKANDLCRKLHEWFESNNSYYYRKAIIDFADGQEEEKNLNILKSHDWYDILFNKQNELNFKMITYPIRSSLLREINISEDTQKIRDYLDKNNFLKIADIFQNKCTTGADYNSKYSYGRDLASLCHDLSGIHNNSSDWDEIKNKIVKLSIKELPFNNNIKAYLKPWLNISNLLSSYFQQKSKNAGLRVEQFVCETNTTQLSDLLALLEMRLLDADQNPPFYALQAVISHPESLLQLYCHSKFNLKFWKFDGLEVDCSDISNFIRRPFVMPSKDSTLGFATLLFLSTYLSAKDNMQNVLVQEFDEMEKYLNIYELRKDQVHSMAFIKNSDWSEYRNFCQKMIDDIRKSLGITNAYSLSLPNEIFTIYFTNLLKMN
ncbi:TPA: hypothetical protein ACW7Y6_003276 [Klebsiella aerogenes]